MEINTQGKNTIGSAWAIITAERVIMDISMKTLTQGIETKCHYHINLSIMTTQILYNISYPSSPKRHGRTVWPDHSCGTTSECGHWQATGKRTDWEMYKIK